MGYLILGEESTNPSSIPSNFRSLRWDNSGKVFLAEPGGSETQIYPPLGFASDVYLSDRTFYVDINNGNDTTAEQNNLQKPYQSITSAISAADAAYPSASRTTPVYIKILEGDYSSEATLQLSRFLYIDSFFSSPSFTSQETILLGNIEVVGGGVWIRGCVITGTIVYNYDVPASTTPIPPALINCQISNAVTCATGSNPGNTFDGIAIDCVFQSAYIADAEGISGEYIRCRFLGDDNFGGNAASSCVYTGYINDCVFQGSTNVLLNNATVNGSIVNTRITSTTNALTADSVGSSAIIQQIIASQATLLDVTNTIEGKIIDCQASTGSFNAAIIGSQALIQNCTASDNSFNGILLGVIDNCRAGSQSYCYNFDIYGTIRDCVGGQECFGAGSTSQIDGVIVNCQAYTNDGAPLDGGDGSFGNTSAILAGIIANCQSGGQSCFKFDTISNTGEIHHCVSSDDSFTCADTMQSEAIIEQCVGGVSCFIFDQLFGSIQYCTASDNSFLANTLISTALLSNCQGGGGSFGGDAIDDTDLIECVGTDSCFVFQSIINNTRFYKCQAKSSSYICSTGDMVDVKYKHCIAEGGSFIAETVMGACVFDFCETGDGSVLVNNGGIVSSIFTHCNFGIACVIAGTGGDIAGCIFNNCKAGANSYNASSAQAIDQCEFFNCNGGGFGQGCTIIDSQLSNCTTVEAGAFGFEGILGNSNLIGCQGGDQSFGYAIINITGYLKDCIGGNQSFGGNDISAGDFYSCKGGDNSFAGDGTVVITSSNFYYCEAGQSSFGYGLDTCYLYCCKALDNSYAVGDYITDSILEYCSGGEQSFATNNFISNSTLIGCIAGSLSYGDDISGICYFRDCIGDTQSFGHTQSFGSNCIAENCVVTDNASPAGGRWAFGRNTCAGTLIGCKAQMQNRTGQLTGKIDRCELTVDFTSNACDAIVINSKFILDNANTPNSHLVGSNFSATNTIFDFQDPASQDLDAGSSINIPITLCASNNSSTLGGNITNTVATPNNVFDNNVTLS